MKGSSRDVEFNFDNPAEVFSPKVWNVFAQKRKRWKFLFLSKNYCLSICSPGHTDCIFDKLAKNFWKKLGYISADNVRKWWQDCLFYKKTKTFLCRGKLRFWQPCWNVSARSSNKVWKSKKIALDFSKKIFLPKRFLRAPSFLTILPKAFAKSWFVFLLIVRKW